jgi:exodeoxyribonuclease X
MKFLILDTETTGLVAPRACEIAWIEVDQGLEVLSEFSSLVNPEVPIGCGASGCHGIRDEDVQASPTMEELPFPEGPVCLIAHNVSFDYPIVKPYINIVKKCDSLVLAKRMLPNSPDHKLQTLACYCELQRSLSHRAIYDCRHVLGLLEYLMEGSGYSLIELIDFANTAKLLSHMPFGKHKGLKMSDVPSSYLKWLAGQDPDLDMAFTLKKMGYL